MRRILRVFFWVLFIVALFIFSFHFENTRDAFSFVQGEENRKAISLEEENRCVFLTNKTFLDKSKLSFRGYLSLSQKDLIKITYCVLDDGEILEYDFYAEKGAAAEDFTLYLGGGAAAYGWYTDLSLTQGFDFSLALTEDVILYAQKILLFEGKGKGEEPLLIKTQSDLELLEKISNEKLFCGVFNVNSQSYENLAEAFSTFCYLLTSDIDAENFVPIFNKNIAFRGSFDGGNNTLSLSGSFEGGCGLFGVISGCLIKNLRLEVDFVSAGGSCNVGAVAALALENVRIEGVTVSGSIKTGNTSLTFGTGGFIGTAKGYLNISNCLSQAEIEGVSNAGGFVGYVNPSPSSGLNFNGCIFSGKITVNKENGKYIGGFVGQIGNGALTVNFSCCINEGAFDAAPQTSCIGGLVGYYTSVLPASKISVDNCANYADILCHKGNRAGGLLGYIKCREIEIKNCANYGEINCLSGGANTNSCGGLLGYTETPCQTVKIYDSLNYGTVKTEGYGGAFCGYVSASGCNAALINCVNAAKIDSVLTPDSLFYKAGASALFSGCLDLEVGKEPASANKLESLAYEYEGGLQEIEISRIWKHLYESYLSFPRQIYLNFALSLESVVVYRYRYTYDAALGEKVLSFAERTEATVEGKRVGFIAQEELSFYVIKVFSQGEGGLDYFFLEITPLYCDFQVHLYQEGEFLDSFTQEQGVWSHNYWKDNGKLYSLYIENLEEGRDYEIAVTLNGAPLCGNAQGAYEFYIKEKGLAAVKIYINGALIKSVNIVFEVDYTLPEGIGTSQNPLLIKNAQELINYLTYTDGGRREGEESVYFLLMQDIDFEGKTWQSVKDFYGVFDGGGYALKNFVFVSGGENKAAFITNLYGKIKNVSFEGASCQTEELYGSILCINIYKGGAADSVVFNDCNVYGGRNPLGLSILAARAAGGGDIYINGCVFYNCFVNGYLNASCVISVLEEGTSLYISNIDAQDCSLAADSQNAAVFAAYVNGFLSIQNCVIKNCVVKADSCASAVTAFCQEGELSVQGITIENCNIFAQNTAGGIAARIEGKGAHFKEIKVSSCVITENGLLYCDRGGAGGILGYGASPVIIERCYVAQSVVVFSSPLYGAAGGIAGVLKSAAKIILCINGARVISQGVFGDAAGIVAYGAESIDIENCANLGLIQCIKGRGGGILSKALENVFISNCYNLGKIIAKKADALVAEAWGGLTLFNIFYFENCAPCALGVALSFDGNCIVLAEARTLNLLDLLYACCNEWEIKENFSFPLLKGYDFIFEYTAEENFVTVREKEKQTVIESEITKDKTAKSSHILLKEVAAQKTYVIDFSTPYDYISVYKNGIFICDLYGGSFEFSFLGGNDFYLFVLHSGERAVFSAGVASDLPNEYEIDSCGDLLTYMQGKQKEGHFDYGLIDLSGKYILQSDIDLASLGAWTPLGSEQNPFCGIFEGRGCKIKNLNISKTCYLGFLGYAKDAYIKDLYLCEVYIEGENYVGAVAGYAENCAVENCFVSGTVRADGSYAGVIVGGCDASTVISGCLAGKESDLAFLFADSKESAYIGGIAGCGGKFYDCTSYVVIRSKSANYVGGIVGAAGEGAAFENCFFAGEIDADALSVKDLPYAGYIWGFAQGENITAVNCGIILKLRCDSALEIEKIEIFNAPYYYETAYLPDGGGNIEAAYRVVWGGLGEGGLSFEETNYGGVTARLKMKNGLYKFIGSIDKKSNIFKTDINVECDVLTSYVGREEYLTIVCEEGLSAVEVENANDFEYLAWAINGGIPLTLKTAEGLIVSYSSFEVKSLSVKLAADIDLTAPRYAVISNGKARLCQGNVLGSFPLNKKGGKEEGDLIYDFYGLGASVFAAYSGSLLGGGHTLKIEVNTPKSFAAGVVAYSSSGQEGGYIDDLTVLGSVKGGKYVGLKGFFKGTEESSLHFNGVTVKICFEGQIAASLLGGVFAPDRLTINVKDCVADASFNTQNAAAFAGENASLERSFALCFWGVNKDYTLLDYASDSQAIVAGSVRRTIKVYYGKGQNEYAEVYTTDANASNVTISALTAEEASFIFEPLTLLFKKENAIIKTFYLFIIKEELSKTYDGNNALFLTDKNYLGSWNVVDSRVYTDDESAQENKSFDASSLAVEGAPVIVYSQSFRVNIDKAPVEVSFKTSSPLIYDGLNHEFAVDILGGELSPESYFLVYYLWESEELKELNGLPLSAASYRAAFVLDNDNFFVIGQNYIDFEIAKKEIVISFPQNYARIKTWGSGDPAWDALPYQTSFENYSEELDIYFHREEGEGVGFYRIFSSSQNGNYKISLASAAYFEIVKASPRLFFASVQTVYDKKPVSFTAFLEGVKGKTQPKGKASYFYYLDRSLTMPTSLSLAGAVEEGGAPLFAGVYFVRAEYAGDENYASVCIVTEVEIKKASPDFSCPLAKSIYAGQSLFDSEFLGGSGEGVFSWKEGIFFEGGGEFAVAAVFSPFDQRNYKCLEFEISVEVLQLTVTFKDALKSLSVNVLYGQSIDKQNYSPFPKLGYSAKWEEVCTQNITKPIVVNALYTLTPPIPSVEGEREVIYGKDLTLTAFATHPLGNLSYAWYKKGGSEIISDSRVLTLSEVSQSGIYTVVVSVFDGKNSAAAQISIEINIKRAYLSLEAYSYLGEYDGQRHGITLELPKGAYARYSLDGIDWEGKSPSFKNACDIEVYFKVEKENYYDFYGSAFVKIEKRRVTVIIDDKQSCYSSPFLPLTYTVIKGSVLLGDDLNIRLAKEEGVNVGAYAISGICRNENYQVLLHEGTYLITPLNLALGEIEFCDGVKEWDGSPQNLLVKGLPDFLSAEYYSDSSCTSAFEGAAEKGVYDIYVKVFSAQGNYLIEGKEVLTLCAKLTVAVKVELTWEIEEEIVYCGKDLRSLIKARFMDEKGNIIEARLTFTKQGEQCPFINAGAYTIYASLGDLYISSSPMYKKVEIKKAKIDLKDVRFDDLAVDFDNCVKSIKIYGALPQGVSVEYFYDGKPFYGTAEKGEYLITARFYAGENYSSLEMTAKLTINRNQRAEEAFKAAVNNLGEISLSSYDRLKELCAMYEEIIYKEGVFESKAKLDGFISAYDKSASRANERKEESQALLQRLFLPSLYAAKALAAAFRLLALAFIRRLKVPR